MCDHIAKVVSWSVDRDQPTAPLVVSLWGCTSCDETFTEKPESVETPTIAIEHTFDCECFGCRARSIKVAYCGIGGGDATAQKQWDRNLDMYRKARAEGIQPTGTSAAKIKAAIRQSDKTGTAFKAG